MWARVSKRIWASGISSFPFLRSLSFFEKIANNPRPFKDESGTSTQLRVLEITFKLTLRATFLLLTPGLSGKCSLQMPMVA